MKKIIACSALGAIAASLAIGGYALIQQNGGEPSEFRGIYDTSLVAFAETSSEITESPMLESKYMISTDSAYLLVVTAFDADTTAYKNVGYKVSVNGETAVDYMNDTYYTGISVNTNSEESHTYTISDIYPDVRATGMIVTELECSSVNTDKIKNEYSITPYMIPEGEESVAVEGTQVTAYSQIQMTNVINANSKGKIPWSAGNIEASYNYDDETASGSFGLNCNAGALVGMGQVTYAKNVGDETILQFTAHLSTNQWEWNHVVFRGGDSLDDFIALAFRKGGGHITMLSRVGGVWYSFNDTDGQGGDAIVTGNSTVKNYELVSSPVLSGITGDTVNMEIRSSSTHVYVYAEGQLIYESALTHALPAATGIFAYSAASSSFALRLTNLRCYSTEIKFVAP